MPLGLHRLQKSAFVGGFEHSEPVFQERKGKTGARLDFFSGGKLRQTFNVPSSHSSAPVSGPVGAQKPLSIQHSGGGISNQVTDVL